MGTFKQNPTQTPGIRHYPHFSHINGRHPFKEFVPEGFVDYSARRLKSGKITYFNFDLAKEMGLISKDHPHTLNSELEREIFQTFNLMIINEYDLEHKIKFSEDDLLPHKYMATRYLQLQHPDKAGRTSGDGRTIWNGTVRHQGKTWDISSCGTGATKLSPACNINKKFYQTGDPAISYGCGLAEVAEGIETLFFSEVLHQNHFQTERILAIIEHEKGLGINVRAHQNLMRPSHFFCHLKQSNYQNLKAVTDYYIHRELENKNWPLSQFKNDKEKYRSLARTIAERFAKMSAQFEDEYIFCWLDWDGDNILMDGGIIDYGSIRQFGLFHAEYRYDDVERFSTTILEQKQKARYIVQCFSQISDFLITGKKKSLSQFQKSAEVKLFDQIFEQEKNKNLLQKIGLKKQYQEELLKNQKDLVIKFRKAFTHFERAKSKRGVYKVADGINRDAIFCMRDILREMPQLYLSKNQNLNHEEFLDVIKSSYAKRADLKLTPMRKRQIDRFQRFYNQIVDHLSKKNGEPRNKILLDITMRSSVINKFDRITGDSISHIVQKVRHLRPKLSPVEMDALVKEFRNYQILDPDQKRQTSSVHERQKHIMRGLSTIVRDCREGL